MHNSECICIHALVQLVDLHRQQVSSNLLIHHAFSMHAIESWFDFLRAYGTSKHSLAAVQSCYLAPYIVLHNAQP